MNWVSEVDQGMLEFICSTFYSDLEAIKFFILKGDMDTALAMIHSAERYVCDQKLAVTGEITKIKPIDQKLSMYERLYHLLFNAITDALEKMYKQQYAEAGSDLQIAQRRAENIYIESRDGFPH